MAPVHDHENTPIVMKYVLDTRPESVLDVGCGSGSYGVLFRDALDRLRLRHHKHEWFAQIDAIEAWPHYVTPLHEYIYDQVFIGNIVSLAHNWPIVLRGGYDLIFMGDVIEHMVADEGRYVLDRLSARCGSLLVSTPLDPGIQGAHGGNPFERHVSRWTREMFTERGFRILGEGEKMLTAVKEMS